MVSVVTNPPASAGDSRDAGQEDPLEKKMAILQYSCLGNPMDRGAGGYSPWSYRESDVTGRVHTHTRAHTHTHTATTLSITNKF